MIYDFDDSTVFLKSILEKLCKMNPSYSRRAFAKKLGLSAGALSHILNGRKKISLDRASTIASLLKLRPKETEYFITLVQMEKSKSASVKLQCWERAIKLNPRLNSASIKTTHLEVDKFKHISDWYGFAILILLTEVKGAWTEKSISKKLNITMAEVLDTIERLMKLDLIRKDVKGHFIKNAGRILTETSIPNESLRRHHEGLHKKSFDSIRHQSPSEKTIGSQIFAFDVSQIEELRELTNKFLDDVGELAEKGANKTEVYQAVANVFRLGSKDYA